jgi:3-hydroxyacyl-CoA dehydrogenase
MAEVFRQFRLGHDLGALNELSVSPLLPRGQVAMMDDIGLDVLLSAVSRYVERMAGGAAADYRQFEEDLSSLVRAGYLGKKNRRPLIKSDPRELRAIIGAETVPRVNDESTALREYFYCLFINSCLTFVETGECSMADLSAALSAVLGTDLTPAEALETAGAATVQGRLEAFYTATGISYFKPSPPLGSRRATRVFR